jgi:spore coat protein U-like protein
MRVIVIILLIAGLSTSLFAQQCEIVSVQDISFGTYDPLAGTNLDAQGRIVVLCDNLGVRFTVKIMQGVCGSFNPRCMKSGDEMLNYNLYTDINRTQIWGDGTGGTQVRRGRGFLNAPVYGRIPGGQDAATGDYADSPLIVVEW